jgi:flagellar assembly protein FliH
MDASFHVRPFAFDRIFSVGSPTDQAPRVGDLQIQIATLEAEIEHMRVEHEAELARARTDGFDAGLSFARTERETAMLSAVDALQASIETVERQMTGVTRQLTEDAAQVAIAGAELLAAQTLAISPGGGIDAAIGRVLKQVARGQELMIHVHPDLVPEMDRLVAGRQSKDRRRLNLHVVGDDGLAMGDAHIEWDQGGVKHDAAARAEALRAQLDSLLPR